MTSCKKIVLNYSLHTKRNHYIKHFDNYKLLTYNTITYKRN